MYFSKYLLDDMLNFAVQHGANRMELNNVLHLTQHNFKEAQYISYEMTIKAINVIGQIINEEYLGLKLGEQLMLKSTEQVDSIMEHSLTLEDAFRNACDYSKLISDALEPQIEISDDHISIQFDVNPNWAVGADTAVQQIIDLTLVCTSKSIFKLTGRERFPIAVQFNYPRPKKINEYFRLFNCSLQFNQSTPAIIFEKQIFNHSILPQNEGLLNTLKRKAQEEINKLDAEPLVVNQIKKLLLNNKPKRLKLNEVAKKINIPSRTLQRTLKQGQTSFKKIETEILLGLAKKMLINSHKSIDEISYLLGFSESSAFIRHFKKEMQMTPNKYRKNVRQ